MSKKPKAKDLLNEVKQDFVKRYNEIMVIEVDETKDLMVKGINNQVGKIYDLLDRIDITNYEEIFSDYENICESIAECDFNVLMCELFDDISLLNKKRDVLVNELSIALDSVAIKAHQLGVYIPLEKVQTSYKQVQHTFIQEFKRYWRMSAVDLVEQVNESFLLAQSLMLQEVRKLDSLNSKQQQLDDTNVVELPIVNKVEYRKITDRKELMKLAQDNGYELVRICGSHHIFKDADGKVVVIPLHSTDIQKGLSHAIQKQVLN